MKLIERNIFCFLFCQIKNCWMIQTKEIFLFIEIFALQRLNKIIFLLTLSPLELKSKRKSKVMLSRGKRNSFVSASFDIPFYWVLASQSNAISRVNKANGFHLSFLFFVFYFLLSDGNGDGTIKIVFVCNPHRQRYMHAYVANKKKQKWKKKKRHCD